ncbi:MAG: hypothetical protein IIC26_06500 [Chloroflexi bacterium]|nr:hypothetical protein [Chloroflexota bacterium]
MKPLPTAVTGAVAVALLGAGIAAAVLLLNGGDAVAPDAPESTASPQDTPVEPALERFGSYGPGGVLSAVGAFPVFIEGGPSELFCGSDADVTTDENGVVTMAQGGIILPSLPVSVEEVVQERANARAQLLLGETVYQPDESVPDRADGIISPFKPASPGRETVKAYFLVPVHYDANGVLVVGMGFCEASTDQILDEAAAFFAQEAER